MAAPRPYSTQPCVTVRVRAGSAAAESRLIGALTGAADLRITGADAADVLVFAIDGAAAEPRRALARASGASKVVVLVDHLDRHWALAALQAGARAVLRSTVSPAALLQAVRAVAAGLVVLDPDAVVPDEREAGAVFTDADSDSALAAPLEPLTERELQVLRLLADGLTNKAIAQRLAITDHTVKFHLASVFSKLDAKSRAEALARGVRFGLLHF